MGHRIIATGTATALVALVVLFGPSLLEDQTVTAQSERAKPGTAEETWNPARTGDGQPDLQGVWNYSNQVPLERPARFAREFLTDEDIAAEKKRAEAYLQGRNRVESREYEFRVWHDRGTVAATRQTSLIVDPPNGQLPALTPEAQKREAVFAAKEAKMRAQDSYADSWLDRNLWERCITTRGGLPKFPGNYNNHVQIFQTPNHVALHYEQIHEARIVPMDGRPRLDKKITQWLGNSRGRWEGNTLVIETANFSDKTEGQPYGPSFREPGQQNIRASGATLHLIERFTRVAPDMLMYEFTVNDPTTWTRAWTARYPMTKTQDRLYEYACHEGNYSMAVGLSGSRAQEGGR